MRKIFNPVSNKGEPRKILGGKNLTVAQPLLPRSGFAPDQSKYCVLHDYIYIYIYTHAK